MQYILTQQELDGLNQQTRDAVKKRILENKDEFKAAIVQFTTACSRIVFDGRGENARVFDHDTALGDAAEALLKRLGVLDLWL